MKIKLKGELKTEQVALKVLCAVGIITFCLSLLVEFIIKHFICKAMYQSFHFDYISNILLGITGSSVISYLSLIFQHRGRRNIQETNIASILTKICTDYTSIYDIIYYKANTTILENDYHLEKMLLENANNLGKLIDEANILYQNSDFTSYDIENIFNVLQNHIAFNLTSIKEFCVMIFSYNAEHNENTTNSFFNIEDINRAIITRAEREYYQFLLKLMEDKYSIDDFSVMFSKIGIKNELSTYVMNSLKDTLDKTYALHRLEEEFKAHTAIRMKFVQLIDKYKKEYFEERDAIQYRLKKTIEKLGDETQNVSNYKSAIERCYKLLECDKITEAMEIVEELENSVM